MESAAPARTGLEDSSAEAGAAEKGLMDRRPAGDWRFHMLAIIAIALVPRFIYLAQVHHWPFFYYPILDSRTQNKWAEILVRSWGIGNSEVLAKPPLYPYFLALTRMAVGSGAPSLFSARLVQLALGATTCGLTYLIGRCVFGATVGLLAGLMLAFYSPAIFAEGELLDTALASFLATSCLLALFTTLDRPSGGRWFGVGLLLGLLGLTRGNLLILAPLFLVFLVVCLRKAGLRAEIGAMAVAFLIGVVLPIAPITARNFMLTGGLIPISTNGGINFYTGNNPEADGYSPIPSGLAWERTWYEQVAGPGGEQRSLGSLTHRQQENYWLGKGLAFWRGRPGKALALLVKKAYLYWGAYDIPNNLSYDWGRARASVLRLVPLTFAVVGPLGLLGMALGGWRTLLARVLTLTIACQMVAVIAFFVCGRYRLPALPAICVFGAFALLELVRLARERRWALVAAAAVGLAALAALVNGDLYRVGRSGGANRDWFYLGQSYAMQQEPGRAREAFQRATEVDPRDPDAWHLLANMAQRQGDTDSAAQAFRQALQVAPDFGDAASGLASLALRQGWPLDESERLLQRALQDQPNHLYALAALVRVYVRQGNREKAAEALTDMTAAFARWNPADTRYAEAQAAAGQATLEATAAGVPLPPRLQGTDYPGGPRTTPSLPTATW